MHVKIAEWKPEALILELELSSVGSDDSDYENFFFSSAFRIS